MSFVSPELFTVLKFSTKDFKNIKKRYKKFHDINSSQYIAIYIDGLYGILDVESEKIVIPPKYQKICDFKEGYAWVKSKNKWGFIDKNLKEIVPPKYSEAFGLDNGNFQLGIIHCVGTREVSDDLSELTTWYKENRKIIPPIIYNRIQGFQEGLVPVKFRKKWGFIDTSGNIVIKSRFEYARPFSYGISSVCLKGKWGFIDKTGKFIIKPQYDDCTSFMKPSTGLIKRDIRRPSHGVLLNYLYNIFKKVYSSGYDSPYAQVEISSDEPGRIRISCINLSGNYVRRNVRKDIEVHSEIY